MSDSDSIKQYFEVTDTDSIQLRDFFAAKAMLAVLQETQEMRIGSFWDWCKHLLVIYFHFTFLTVRYVKVSGVYEDAAKRSYEYADAMMLAREQNSKVG